MDAGEQHETVALGRALAVGLVVGWLAAACADPGVFACQLDAQCGMQGRCEATGFCSFPDSECLSGHRYGEHAEPELAGTCVDESSQGTAEVPGGSAGSLPSDASGSGEVMPTSSDPTSPVDDGTTGTDTTDSPPEDLLLWYEFEEDPGMVGGAIDSGPLGIDAECDGVCPQSVPGVIGNAAAFDGEQTVLTAFELPDRMLEGGFTLALFGRDFDLPSDDDRMLAGKTYGTGLYNSFGLALFGMPDKDLVGLVTAPPGTSTTFVQGGAPLGARWRHLALTWDGDEAVLYVDGVVVTSEPVSDVGFDDHPLMVGADINFDELTSYFNGEIDDLRIYARALTPAEVLGLSRLGD